MDETEKRRIAKALHDRVMELRLMGVDDVTLFVTMAERMPDFKRLLDAASRGEMDDLAVRFPAFGQYAALLTSIVGGIRDGTIMVPK